MSGLSALWAATSLSWLVLGLMSLRSVPRLRVFDEIRPQEPRVWPRLSVIVPACNEASTIVSASQSLRAQDYPDLQLVLIDDRSTDDTGKLVDAIAKDDARISPVHIETLPNGWLGKVHAMHTGVGLADGEWLLFTDADVHFEPDALRRAIAWAEAEKLDHVTVIPRVDANSWWTHVAVGAFATLLLQVTRASEVGRPGSDACLGVGAFNLVRRDVFDKTPGLQWLRLELLDDLGLAQMMRAAGARSGLAIARQAMWLTWYTDLHEMIHGLEKNLFSAVGRFSWLWAAAAAFLLTGVAIGPIAALGLGPWWLRGLSLAAMATLFAGSWATARRFELRWTPMVMWPAGMLLLVYASLRSAVKTWQNNGIYWRGTHYPLNALRQGRRVEL